MSIVVYIDVPIIIIRLHFISNDVDVNIYTNNLVHFFGTLLVQISGTLYVSTDNWSGIIPFFAFPEEIRKVIYTTNSIESVNRQIRKIIKNKGVFPSDESIKKIIYLALKKAAKKWTMPIKNWPLALNQFEILCGDFKQDLLEHKF